MTVHHWRPRHRRISGTESDSGERSAAGDDRSAGMGPETGLRGLFFGWRVVAAAFVYALFAWGVAF